MLFRSVGDSSVPVRESATESVDRHARQRSFTLAPHAHLRWRAVPVSAGVRADFIHAVCGRSEQSAGDPSVPVRESVTESVDNLPPADMGHATCQPPLQ